MNNTDFVLYICICLDLYQTGPESGKQLDNGPNGEQVLDTRGHTRAHPTLPAAHMARECFNVIG